MKTSQLLTVGFIACLGVSVAASDPAASPRAASRSKAAAPAVRDPMPCLLGSQKCSAISEIPARTCLIGATVRAACPSDGYKVTEADFRSR